MGLPRCCVASMLCCCNAVLLQCCIAAMLCRFFCFLRALEHEERALHYCYDKLDTLDPIQSHAFILSLKRCRGPVSHHSHSIPLLYSNKCIAYCVSDVWFKSFYHRAGWTLQNPKEVKWTVCIAKIYKRALGKDPIFQWMLSLPVYAPSILFDQAPTARTYFPLLAKSI